MINREVDEIRIRQATIEDASTICSWWNDGQVMAHAGFPNGLNTTVENVEKILLRNNELNQILIIEFQNQPIGEMSFRILDSVAQIGIKIAYPVNQSRGLGTLCLTLLIDELFKMNVDKIVLDTNIKNIRAQNLYRKLGFKQVRINKDCWCDQLGELQTSIDFELCKEDRIEKPCD